MKRIAVLAALRPVSTVTAWTAVAMLGAVALSHLPLETAPPLEIPRIRIVTELHGLQAAQVEKLVTVPVEESVSTVTGIRAIRSVSKRGLSSVELDFDWGVRVGDVTVQVRERIDAVHPLLPWGASKPAVFTERLDETPLMVVSVRHEDSPAAIKPLVELEILPSLRQNADVGRVVSLGMGEREIQVNADPQRLAAIGMSVRDLGALIASSVYEGAIGTLRQRGYTRPIRITTGVDHITSLAAVPLYRGSSGNTLSDVADVIIAERTRTSFFLDGAGHSAAGLLIYRSAGSGTVRAARAIEATLNAISARVGPSVTLEVVQDESQMARRALRGLMTSAALGGAAAILVLLALLRSRRAVAITLTSIPVCVLTLFLVLYIARVSLNLMTLTGITIGVGMIIDNSIVVLEKLSRLKTATPFRVAHATAEMTTTTWSSTVTTLLVFVPVLLVPGAMGALFTELAVTLGTLLIISFFCSATLTPALYLLRTGAELPNTTAAGLPLQIERRYVRLLSTAVRHSSRTVLLFCSAIVLGFALLTMLPRSVLPPSPPRHVVVRLTLPPAADADATARAARLLMREVSRTIPLESAYAHGGYERGAIEQQSRAGTGTHAAEVVFDVSPSVADPLTEIEKTLAKLRTDTEFSAGTRAAVFPRQSAMETLLAGPRGAPRYRITVGTRKEAAVLSHRLGLHAPQYEIRFDAEAGAASGISAREAIDHLAASVDGVSAGRMTVQEHDYDIRVQAARASVATASDLKRLPLPSGTGSVAAGTVITPVWSAEPFELHRFNRSPAVEYSPAEYSPAESVSFDPKSRSQPSDTEQLRQSLSASVVSRIGVSEMHAAGTDLLRVAILALALMFLMLTAQFESPAVALLLMSVLPASLCGSALALWVTGHGLHLHSVLGMLVVLGTSINATIILTAVYRQRHRRGALIAATRGRLPSILATTLTTVAALAPLALDMRPRNMAHASMAVAVAGGLLSGTLFAVLVYPSAYRLLSSTRGE